MVGLTINGLDELDRGNLHSKPSFSIKSLLDKIGGRQTIQTGDFDSETITSKYYTPLEFFDSKFSKVQRSPHKYHFPTGLY